MHAGSTHAYKLIADRGSSLVCHVFGLRQVGVTDDPHVRAVSYSRLHRSEQLAGFGDHNRLAPVKEDEDRPFGTDRGARR